MTVKRKIFVNILATIAFVFLFLLPVIGFFATDVNAVSTTQSAASYSNDYVFFIVQNEDVPLSAVPTTNISSYILWIGLASFVVVMVFVYSAWYLSIRRNIWELSSKLTPLERRTIKVAMGFFHPVRSYRLAKETEDSVASMYMNYI